MRLAWELSPGYISCTLCSDLALGNSICMALGVLDQRVPPMPVRLESIGIDDHVDRVEIHHIIGYPVLC
jgi:hypothetical protein